jgi:multicomponent Na+:H+ antiporter subunit C
VSVAHLLVIAVLFAVGTYLVQQRSLTRIVLGVAMLANGINVLIVAAAGRPAGVPIVGEAGEQSDPVPQALVLTAIVIGFALISFMLALAWRNWTVFDDDQVEDDVEDRRLAAELRESDGRPHPEDPA